MGTEGASETTPPEVPRGAVPTAIVAAQDFRTRLLLRGLLLTQHVQIVGEAETSRQCLSLVRRARPSHLIVHLNLGDGTAFGMIAEVRGAVPGVRIILVTPLQRAGSLGQKPSERPDAVLAEPFTMLDFSAALYPPAEGAASGGAAKTLAHERQRAFEP